jgi:hypothetical protein
MSWKTDAAFHQKVGELCDQHYTTRLTKRGKPQSGKEWTLMAAFVISTGKTHLRKTMDLECLFSWITGTQSTLCILEGEGCIDECLMYILSTPYNPQNMFSETSDGSQLTVASMATGSKCIGPSKITSNGDILHDSHAEVLAKRAFLS